MRNFHLVSGSGKRLRLNQAEAPRRSTASRQQMTVVVVPVDGIRGGGCIANGISGPLAAASVNEKSLMRNIPHKAPKE